MSGQITLDSRILKMLESGIDPGTSWFEVGIKVRTVNIVYLYWSSCHSPRNYRAPIQIYYIYCTVGEKNGGQITLDSRIFKMLESGIDPATVRFEVGKK